MKKEYIMDFDFASLYAPMSVFNKKIDIIVLIRKKKLDKLINES